MKPTLLLLTISILIFSSGVANAQRTTRTPAPNPFEALDYPDNETLPQDNFSTKGMPIPPVLGSDPTDALAVRLAKDISKYDEDSLGLLMAALQKAGFFIIDQSGKTLYAPTDEHSLGIAFFDYEVVGMLKASSIGSTTTMGKIAAAIAQKDPGMTAVIRADVMASDLRKARTSKYPQVKFLATLVTELGKHLATPVDLSTAPADTATITMIQASVIERILLRDFLYLAENTQAVSSPGLVDELFRPRQQNVLFVNASYRQNVGCDLLTDITAIQKDEKNAKKIIEALAMYGQLFDWATIENGFKKLNLPSFTRIDFLKKYATGTKIANAALSWVKLVMALANIKTTVEVEDPMPLIRTKSSRNPGGEARKLTAKFRIDIANSSLISCVGKGLSAATGLSYSVPKTGPMANVPVAWELLDPGDTADKYIVNAVYLDSLKTDDLSKQKTNAAGETFSMMTGKPQRTSLEGQKVVPFPKRAVVRVRVAVEDMDAKNDIPKIFSNLFGPEIGPLGLVTGLISLAPEILSKMKLSAYKVAIPVRDWQPCTADWSGTITVKHEWSKPQVLTSSKLENGNTTGNGFRRQSVYNEANVTLRPRVPNEIGVKPPNPAMAAINGNFLDLTEFLRDKDPCCGKKEGSYKTKVRKGTEMKYNKIVDSSTLVDYRGSERDFQLSLRVPIENFPVNYRHFQEVESDCETEDESFSNDIENNFALDYILPDGRYGYREVNTAGELLWGTKDIVIGDNKYAWAWALARCPDPQ